MDIIFSNMTTFACIIGTLIFILTNHTFSARVTNVFTHFDLVVLCLLITEIFEYSFAAQPTFQPGRVVTTALGYFLRPLTLMTVITISGRGKRWRVILWLLLAAEGLLVFTSQWTRLVYWFDAQNMFHRGPMGYVSHILSGVLMLAMVLINIFDKKRPDKGENAIIFFIALICVVATVLESVLGYKFMLVNAMAVSCIFYYLYLCTRIYKYDPLTGVLNRLSFGMETERMKSGQAAVICADLDKLKAINDSRGHNAGDEALKTFAAALTETDEKGFVVFRTGGDEFTVLGADKTREEAQRYIKKVEHILTTTPYSASFGLAMLTPEDSIESVIRIADAAMYEAKKRPAHAALKTK